MSRRQGGGCGGDYAAAFRAYQQARYLRTGRVQIMARVYGEFYHAGGVAKELRNMMLGARTPEDAMAGMEWLYGRAEGTDAGWRPRASYRRPAASNAGYR